MKQLYYFSASWCPSCQTFEPVINQAQQQGAKVTKVNVDHEPSLTTRYGIRSIPVTILIEDGKEKGRFVGARSLRQVMDFYNQ
jgi:thioredoxin 1